MAVTLFSSRSQRAIARGRGYSLVALTLLPTIALAMLLASACAGILGSESGLPSEQASQRLPSDFTFTLYQEEDVLGEDAQRFSDVFAAGKPVVLNFWAGSCPPCVSEMPHFQQVYEEHWQDLVMFGLDVGPFTGLGTEAQGKDLLRSLGITFPAGTPPDAEPVIAYEVLNLPTTIFFTPDGRVYDSYGGALTRAQLEKMVAGLLARTSGS